MANNPMLAPMATGSVPRPHYGDQQLKRLLAAASTNATLLKNGPGTVDEIVVYNTTAAAVFLKFYDKATAPVVGTDIPAFTLQIPVLGSGIGYFVIQAGLGKPFANGIGFAITGAAADSDTTAVAAGATDGYVLWS